MTLKPRQTSPAGFTFEVRDINLTVDLFDIRMKDRLALSRDNLLTDAQRAQLLAEGVTSAAGLQEFRFFTNDFDTTTNGVDVVLTVPVPNGDVTAVYNRTVTEVTQFNPKTLDELRIRELEENLPKQRASLTVTQSITSQWSVLGRGSYFGDWFDSEDGETYTGKVLFDLETTYWAAVGLNISLGVQNLLDQYPDENPGSGNIGNQYGQFSPFGFNGRYVYAKFGYTF